MELLTGSELRRIHLLRCWVIKSAFQNLVRLIRREYETGDILGRFASFRSVLLNFRHPNGGLKCALSLRFNSTDGKGCGRLWVGA
jgi:hypothetical protein